MLVARVSAQFPSRELAHVSFPLSRIFVSYTFDRAQDRWRTFRDRRARDLDHILSLPDPWVYAYMIDVRVYAREFAKNVNDTFLHCSDMSLYLSLFFWFNGINGNRWMCVCVIERWELFKIRRERKSGIDEDDGGLLISIVIREIAQLAVIEEVSVPPRFVNIILRRVEFFRICTWLK